MSRWGPVNEAIADGVGDRGLPDGGVPGRRRQLARNQVEQVPPFRIGERRQQPIIDRQEIEHGETRE